LNSSPSSGNAATFSPDPTKPILACDGQGLKQLFNASLQWMEQHTAVINSLNVFPVPDGDTGTNMFLTLQAACQEIAEQPDKQVGIIAQYASRGALMGARGNSGVILSQILRGMAQRLEGQEDFNTVEFANALKQGAAVAYKAVIKPVEGTILTVVRESGDAACEVSSQLTDLRELLEYVVHAARDSVTRTPSLLPVLREAGVVDAGGQGLFVIFEGMARYLQGESMVSDQALFHGVDLQVAQGEQVYGYDVQYVLHGTNLQVDQIKADIAVMGDCPLIVGDSTMIKVHIHTPSPGEPLDYGAKLGSLSRVLVENMQEQYQEFIMGQAGPALAAREEAELNIATVVVSPGQGLSKLFRSLGAAVIVSGGQTMNPSIEQLLQAIEDAPAQEVIVLPNNSNIILAAQQAQALSGKRVRVVPTKTVPQGVSALLAYNYSADLGANTRAMERGAEEVRTAEITTAVRDVRLNSLEVKEGEIIGLVDGELVVVGHSLEETAFEVLLRLEADDAEILTFYYGESVPEEDAEALVEKVESRYPDAEIEVVDGGQPHYHYIISAE
jgi:DAK2 domain fusion protein YloV